MHIPSEIAGSTATIDDPRARPMPRARDPFPANRLRGDRFERISRLFRLDSDPRHTRALFFGRFPTQQPLYVQKLAPAERAQAFQVNAD
jgi:hypothetical protein